MTLGYKQTFPDGTPTHFEEKITLVEGYAPKIHSIREDPQDRWPPRTGIIHHVYGNRTAQRRCFRLTPSVSTQRITIIYTNNIETDVDGNVIARNGMQPMVMVDGMVMDDEKVTLIAKNDGFPSKEKFFEWFSKNFSGKIIHWTKLRY